MSFAEIAGSRAEKACCGRRCVCMSSSVRSLLLLLLLALPGASVCVSMAEVPTGFSTTRGQMERSFWLHASLGLFTQKNYFGADYPATSMPMRGEIENAARLLTSTYAANRLYLIYHCEVAVEDARKLFLWWRAACPDSVEIVPALVLRAYDKAQTPVFGPRDLGALVSFFREELRVSRLAVYDIASGRDQGAGLKVVADAFPDGIVRLGLQPDERLDAPFASAVADTWSALCHGRRNDEDWRQPGFGAETLRKWVAARDADTPPVVWNLVAVAWDYAATGRGGYPGYDDAEKNMPLPGGRNRLAMQLIRDTAKAGRCGGFSSDLYILHENSRSTAHDGRERSFYECLKRGENYRGFYAVPFQEIVTLFGELRLRDK